MPIIWPWNLFLSRPIWTLIYLHADTIWYVTMKMRLSFHSQATSSSLNPKSSMLQQHCQLAWWNVFLKQWTHSGAITWSAQSTLAKYTTPSWTRFGPVKSFATRSKCGCNTSTDKSPMQNIHRECELSHILLYLPLRISQEGLILLAHLIFFASRAPVPFQQVCTTC